MIGSGIFLVPGTIAQQVDGDMGWALVAWLAGGALSFIGALTLAELTAMKPDAGGIYVFIRDCFGQVPAFLYGWTLFFVITSGTAAALAAAFSDNLRQIVPMPAVAGKIIAIAFIGLVALINVCGTRFSANIQNVLAVIKIGSVLTISLVLLSSTRGTVDPHNFIPKGANWGVVSAFGMAIISTLWAYEGWQYATYIAEETRNPERDFPRAFLLGMLVVIAIYLIVNVAYCAALTGSGMAKSNNVAVDAIRVTNGRLAATMVVAAFAVSVFGGANGLFLTNTRVFYAMARDGVFFDRLATIHPRFGTPAFAIIWGGCGAAVLALSGTFNQLLTCVIFTGWLFYALAVTCIFVYRRRFPEEHRPYVAPGYPWAPAIFVAVALALAANTLIRQPGRSLLGLSLVSLGLPAHFIWKRIKGTAPKKQFP